MILVDADVLVALVNRADAGHRSCVDTLRQLREPLATVWPALAAALAWTAAAPPAQGAILQMIERGTLDLLELRREDAVALRALLMKRRARALSVAHAALIRVAERDGLDTVFTLAHAALATHNLGGGRRRLRLLPGRASRPAAGGRTVSPKRRKQARK